MGKRERVSGIEVMDTDLRLREITNILEALQAAKSRPKKLAILRANKSFPMFASVLRYTLGLIKSNITKEKIERHIFYIDKPSGVPNNWNDMMMYFELNPTGTDEDVAVTQLYIKKYPIEDREKLTAIISRKIETGVTLNMAVKVFGEEFYEGTYYETGNKAAGSS